MIVLDTDVVSELMRPAPDSAVVTWLRDAASQGLVTTAITAAEISYGIARLPDGARKAALQATASEVFSSFSEQVLPFDSTAATAYAALVSDRDRAGLPINGFHAQIAAICRSMSATLATRNGKDFHGTGIVVLDPWSSPSR